MAESPNEILETISPSYDAVRWTFTYAGETHEFVQRPLSFFANMEWFALVADTIDGIVQSEGGEDVSLGLAALLGGGVRTDDLAAMTSMIGALTKLTAHAPDFLARSYCTWLGVRREQRSWAISAFEDPDAGFSNADGMRVIEVFVEQNGEALRSFFTVQGPALLQKLGVTTEASPAPPEPTAPSKRSKPTPRRTASG